MYIPDYPKLSLIPEFVTDYVDATYASNIELLKELHAEAVKLNECEGYYPSFSVYEEQQPYSDDTYGRAKFDYKRKPTQEEIDGVNSYNHRMITNYNDFIDKNTEVAKSLKMKKYE